jgi:chlorobactene glucosyltransferase
MYTGFRDAVNGFSKNVTAYFGNSFILAILFWLVTGFGFIPVILACPDRILFTWLAMIIITRIFISLASRQNILLNLLFMIPCMHLLDSSYISVYKQLLWHF